MMITNEYVPDISQLCQKFKVDFTVSIDPTYQSEVVLNFGPYVKYYIMAGQSLSPYDLHNISQRLAATYPEEVLGSISERYQKVLLDMGVDPLVFSHNLKHPSSTVGHVVQETP